MGWTPWYQLLWGSVSLGVTIGSVNVWWTPVSRRQCLVLWRYRGDQVKVLASTSFQPKRVMNTEVWLKPHQWATNPAPYQLSDKKTQRRWVNRILFALLIETLSWKMRKISIREIKRSTLPSVKVPQRMWWRGEALVLCMSWLSDRPKIFQILFAQGDSHKKQCWATFLKVNKYTV